MTVTPVPTADLVDQYGTELRVCDLQFRQFGAHRSFAGPVRTVSCHEDNGLLRDLLRTPATEPSSSSTAAAPCAPPWSATSSPAPPRTTAGPV